MKKLCDEVSRRFPELRGHDWFDEESGHNMLYCLARWLDEQPGISTELVHRVRDLDTWCFDQPRGTSAEDDILSILIVSFHEELFKLDHAREWIPQLLPRDDLVENRDYYVQWVGQENYDKTLALYGAGPTEA